MTLGTARAGGEVARPERPGMFAALSVPSYPSILLAGWFWGICRWGVSFLGAYLANSMTGSARLVQLTGVAMWAPLLMGGVLGGVISDRFDRRRTVIAQFVVLVPLAAAMGVAGLADRIELWMVYVFLVAVGIGWVADMTSRRAIIYDLVGPSRLDNAMALESLSSSTGLVLGALVGGSAIEAVGTGAAYLCIAGLGLVALVLFARVPRVPRTTAARAESGLVAMRAGFRLLRTERALVSVLGVTAVVNFFFFAFTPLVQVVATDLGVGAFLTGVLASMVGFGMMAGSSFVARNQPHRRGRVYVTGSAMALVLLVPFALSPWFVTAALSLVVAATGMGLFGSTQSTLVMTAVAPELRGRALGLLSTAIGVLPIGMITLGELAEAVGARAAIVTSAVTGGLALVCWLLYRPDVARMTTD
ncbi:MAG: MFS transporter [Acidimicrobiia bacterium]|nr:MFS transporter [Acidimicrobiia bacterium]